MATNDFLPFAVGGSANVLSQSAYAALAALTNGYQSGVANSAQINKTFRQSSIMAAVLAQFISDQTGANSVDDGTTATLLANLKLAVRAFKTVKRTLFTASGTYTPSAGLLYAEVEVLGGGGGGATGSSSNAAGGGAAGGYCKAIFSASALGASQTVTVGAGGAAGSAPGNGGSGGGQSSFGTLIVCAGGAGGSLTASTTTIGQPSGGGSVTTAPAGSIWSNGAFGRYGFGSASVQVGGDGAASIYGSGANGAGTGAGSTGSGYGGGGGGSHASTGGVGRPGLVVVTEYCSQ
ncbi:hypothetical protein [Caballeronia sp. NCTM5]|uniref:glycine-rich domain-containing protein n=1 Tax=Caballeronia sp. NCTM5 TaxID=2921755 RepID=UPI0020293B1A|nr:hypothetical protein [Caballeronia sp. NCTM5]